MCIVPTVDVARLEAPSASSSASAASTSARIRRARATSRLAGVGDRHLPRRPLDQRQADLVLEPADLLGERGLGDVLARRGAGEVALVGERDEVAELAKIHKHSL